MSHIAVLVPCYNEALTVGNVVRDFKRALPDAEVYVYDNNSQDRTIEVARAAGACVARVSQQGKGHVMRRMFADIEADIYIMVDGDNTYHAPSAKRLIGKLVDEKLDMVTGCRKSTQDEAYRKGHRFGNVLLTRVVGKIFGGLFTDMLSGYRAFSRRYVKSFPTLSTGFEIETELTIHALELGMPIGEIDTPYGTRPEGSASKLNTYRDGWRILMTILNLYKTERPLAFFSLISTLFALTSVALAVPIFITFFETGLVPRFPTAILATGLMILAFLSLTCGIILDTVTRGRRELKRLFYLSIESIHK